MTEQPTTEQLIAEMNDITEEIRADMCRPHAYTQERFDSREKLHKRLQELEEKLNKHQQTK